MSAQESAPGFGGLRGGRKRTDGLIPGSAEALEADRRRDRERKAKQRASIQSGKEPPALPPLGGPGPPQGPALAPVPESAGLPLVPWTAQDWQPSIDQLVPALEEAMTAQLRGKALDARLSSAIVQDVEDKAKWNPVAKKGILMSGPPAMADLCNSLGIPSKYKHGVVLVPSIAAIAGHHMQLVRRLDKLIQMAQASNKPAKNPEPAAPPAKADNRTHENLT